jgi:hypothetical protein
MMRQPSYSSRAATLVSSREICDDFYHHTLLRRHHPSQTRSGKQFATPNPSFGMNLQAC